ncbi:MAG: hypothetical protein KDI13_06680 [Alphaproteobacteria bacterium]|nr:hypothetical protein [Alphaproteobacteria bacterium]
MGWKKIAAASAAGLLTFNAAAAPPVDKTQVTPAATQPACTVRLNIINRETLLTDTIDERYIGTKYADSNFSGLNYPFGWEGISYAQTGTIGGKPAANYEVSLQAESGLKDWNMPSAGFSATPQYYEPATPPAGNIITGTTSYLYDARYTNWSQSAEVRIDNPDTCLSIRDAIEHPPSEFSLRHNGNEFAETTFAKTGYPTDFDELKNTPGVTIIDRETRLEQDRASGQLPMPTATNLPAPWKN